MIQERILAGVRSILQRESPPEERLRSLCDFLREQVDHYDWVGFYFVDPEKKDELVLGPYSGEQTEHVRIRFGDGICGQAARNRDVFVVQDVSKESNYLSCSPEVKSEIVIPIFKNGEIIGELDIDSHRISPFGEKDRRFLEGVCEMVKDIV